MKGLRKQLEPSSQLNYYCQSRKSLAGLKARKKAKARKLQMIKHYGIDGGLRDEKR